MSFNFTALLVLALSGVALYLAISGRYASVGKALQSIPFAPAQPATGAAEYVGGLRTTTASNGGTPGQAPAGSTING